MKITLSKNYILVITLAIASSLTSCNKLQSSFGGSRSSSTGWEYNSAENGGFEYDANYTQPVGPGLIHIPGGSFVMGQTLEDVMKENNNTPKRVTVSSFFLDETEVRNIDYLEYLHWLYRVFADKKSEYTKALPDTLVWRSSLAYNEPLVRNYLRFKAYANYPVVGVSWEQANKFCTWRTDRVNEKILIDNGYLEYTPDEQTSSNHFNTQAYINGQYKASTETEKSKKGSKWNDGLLLPNYRLPTEAEWEYAAYGLVGNTSEERITHQRIFPWDGSWVRNPDKKHRGKFLANFVRGKGDYMGIAPNPNDGGVQTVNVRSFWTNDFGLYCMAGNVNEWVADVYRQTSSEEINEFNPFRGNVFEKIVIDSVTGRPLKDSLGRIVYAPQTKEELASRKNYRTADNRNYNDGDLKSRINKNSRWTGVDSTGTAGMYIKNKDNMTTLVSDESRVYKGGSWKDRVYWLSPGTRRFLSQKESADDIGFRCAMSQVGTHKK